MIRRLLAMGDVELVMPDGVVVEVANRQIIWNEKPVRQGMPIMVERNNPAYQSVLKELENNNVGQVKGASDRQIIADTLFARTEPGVTPTFTTHDSGIYNKLWKMAFGAEPHPRHFGGKTLPEAYPNGFDVTIQEKTIRIIPIPKK